MENTNKCPHCDPYEVHRAHILDRVGMVLESFFDFITTPVRRVFGGRSRAHHFVSTTASRVLVNVLVSSRILQEVRISPLDKNVYNRTLVLVEEAEKRNIDLCALRVFGKIDIGLFSIEINGSKRIFDGLPHMAIDQVYSGPDLGDKHRVKEVLLRAGAPCPEGFVCRNYDDALVAVEDIKFPVVVKPLRGSLSRHTICNIQTKDDLMEAVRVVKIITREFVVEKFVEGSVYRITVVAGNVVAACLREAPNVIGDGVHTVRELVDMKNRNPLRRELGQKNITFRKIILNTNTENILAGQGRSSGSILRSGEKIYLHNKVILSCGTDIHDVTDVVHSENIALFKKVYEVCATSVIGIDFIAKDISIPYYVQPCAVLEVNDLPYIDMHHYPTTGKPRNVAGVILDSLRLE